MSDLISREAVINDINALLKSPFAHSEFGKVTKEEAFCIRKEMAEIIIDLCVKSAKTAYDVDKVMEKLEERKSDNMRISKLQGNSHTKKISHICRSDEDDYLIHLLKGAVKDE